MDERCRRQFTGLLAQEDRYGGVSLISKVTGLNHMTILKGIEELKHLPLAP